MRFLKPATHDLKVPDPERGGFLPPDGAYVPDTEYWRRRGSDEVTEATPPTNDDDATAPDAKKKG